MPVPFLTHFALLPSLSSQDVSRALRAKVDKAEAAEAAEEAAAAAKETAGKHVERALGSLRSEHAAALSSGLRSNHAKTAESLSSLLQVSIGPFFFLSSSLLPLLPQFKAAEQQPVR